MFKFYLEPLAWFKYYYRKEAGSDCVIRLIEGFKMENLIGVSSHYSLNEMIRGFIKLRNEGLITEREALAAILTMLDDIRKKSENGYITLVEVSNELVVAARRHITEINLTTSDAIHYESLLMESCTHMLNADDHYLKDEITKLVKIINPTKPDAEYEIKELISQLKR